MVNYFSNSNCLVLVLAGTGTVNVFIYGIDLSMFSYVPIVNQKKKITSNVIA
jgi:hypothetical protein